MCAENIACLKSFRAFDIGEYTIKLFIERMDGRISASWLKCKQRMYPHKHNAWRRSVRAGYVDALLRDLEQARIPALPEEIMSCDGATYELVINKGMNSVTCCWWNEAPKGNEPVERFAGELKKLARVESRLWNKVDG